MTASSESTALVRVPSISALFATRLTQLALAIFWVMPLAWAVVHFWPPVNHDAAAILQFSERILSGERLYNDLFDINPPTIFWLNLIPAGLAQLTSISALVWLIITVTILALWCLFLCRRPFRGLTRGRPAFSILMPPLALFTLFVLPDYSFAQREHIIAMLSLPYLCLAASRAEHANVRRWLNIVAGCLLAIAITIKPHYLLVPLLVEFWLAYELGWRRVLRAIAPQATMVTGFVILIAALIFTPAYFTFVLPIGWGDYAADPTTHFASLWWGDNVPALGLFVVIMLPVAFSRLGNPLARVLALFTLAALVAGLLQDRDWNYHFLCARIGEIMLAGTLLAEIYDKAASRMNTGTHSAAAILALVFLSIVYAMSGELSPPFGFIRGFATSPAGRIEALIDHEAHGKPVLWLTSSIYPQFPVLNMTHSRQAMPFMSLWLLPALYQNAPSVGDILLYRTPQAMSPAEKFVFNSVGAEIKRQPPKLIISTRAADEPGFQGRQFNYIDYFNRQPDFAATFQSYQPLAQIAGWTIYERRE